MCIGKQFLINKIGNIELTIQQQRIEKVCVMKYLGVMIGKNLNFKEHNQYIVKKVAKMVYFMGRMKRKLDKDTKLLLYKSLIVPHIDYSSSILFLCNSSVIQIVYNVFKIRF